MKTLINAWAWMSDRPRQRTGVRVLQVAVGLMLLFRVFTEAPFAGFLWGPRGLGYGSGRLGADSFMGVILDAVFTPELGVYAVLFTLGAGALGLLAGYRTRWATLLALASFTLLGARLAELGDGGDNVTQLVLVYMLFLLPAGAEAARGSAAVWLHNVAVASIAAQLVVLYMTSGFLKVTGEVWQNGTAMYLISQVQNFSLPGWGEMFKNPLVTTTASYSAMFFQVWFPLAVFSRAKHVWICVGVCFHLGIAVFMGLVTFSTVMIGLELFLVSDPDYARLAARLAAARGWLARRLPFEAARG
ncbi:MAG TPA: hypothetical protein VF591_10895 [Pyrinomonadaceae bacterium]|jgi:hypothetical protein